VNLAEPGVTPTVSRSARKPSVPAAAVISITGAGATIEAIMGGTLPSIAMNFIEDVTVELANDGIIVRRPTSADVETEYYVIGDASLYTEDRYGYVSLVPLFRLWLIWFGSFPLLAALVYLSVLVFGS